MKCTILHEGKGRMRVHVENVRMTLHRADVLEAYLNHKDAIVHAAVYERTGDVVITYTGKRTAAIAILAGYKFDVAEYDALVTSADSRRLNREYQDKMFDLVAGRCLRKLFLPAPLDAAYTAFRSIRFLWKGVRCVLSRRLEVEVLDALSDPSDDEPIHAVFERVGYTSRSTYLRIFRKEVGCAPSKYRQEIRKIRAERKNVRI